MIGSRGTGLARAPGKLVLSGSYSVLWGAPAIVTAVDRFAVADRGRAAVHVAEEVVAAVELGLVPAPCFVDAMQLRVDEGGGRSRKLGLGSSAAILLATLVAHRGAPADDEARSALFRDALAAHRKAQGGGSGIDVAASTFGGTRSFRIEAGEARIAPAPLPPGLVVTIFAARTSAVTAGFVARVRAFAAERPGDFEPLLTRARSGADGAVEARTVEAFLGALVAQRDALAILGDLAGVPIVTPEVHALARSATEAGAFFGPSGAGGGDVAFHASTSAPPASFVAEAASRGYDALFCGIGAPGADECAR